ncbi:hypothetical protein PanWU01x14_248840 [Parasponia andersonii]|uniref:Uncharacterized protein n=1 Tax=Parasponia andersonii TaxID=3476 RepID=A0A2P5BDB3_PARAD|nr:hypothetical protein PanWU01x14_248840 [Parasponia andersonii]
MKQCLWILQTLTDASNELDVAQMISAQMTRDGMELGLNESIEGCFKRSNGNKTVRTRTTSVDKCEPKKFGRGRSTVWLGGANLGAGPKGCGFGGDVIRDWKYATE